MTQSEADLTKCRGTGTSRYLYDGDSLLGESTTGDNLPERFYVPGVGYYHTATSRYDYYRNTPLRPQPAPGNSAGTVVNRTTVSGRVPKPPTELSTRCSTSNLLYNRYCHG